MHHKFQQWYKCQVPHKRVRTPRKSQPQFQPMSLKGHYRAPLDSLLPIFESWWRTDITHKIRYCIINYRYKSVVSVKIQHTCKMRSYTLSK